MKKTFYLFGYIMTTMFMIFSHAHSQIDLKEYARLQGLQWQTQRTYAESIAIAKHMPIRADRDGRTIELQRIENGIPIYYTTENLKAAKTLSSNKVWPGGSAGLSLTGEGILLGEWDAGRPRTTHQEYAGRILSTQGSLHYHSAHVAGTMIAAGIDANAKGMSNKASLKCFDWNNDDAEMASQAAGGLRVSNHSYGQITGWEYDYRGDGKWAWFGDTAISETEDYKFGFYDAGAQSWDNIARNAPYYLIVKAAGNDRNDGIVVGAHWALVNGSWSWSTKMRSRDGRSGGYDCIGPYTVAKNILTVGAVSAIPGGYTKPSDVVMSGFSCWGPTDDGRIKPDIVADGVSLYSTLETADNAYGTLSGTSMASPNATGSIGLLLNEQLNQHGSTPIRSSTLKAIIINTADEAGSYPGPDYSFGWGLMNTLKAVRLMQKDSIDGYNSHLQEILMNQGDTIRFDIGCNGTDTIKATVCWTDPAGNPVGPSLNPQNIMLRNDIDLRITKKYNNTVYYPWILNPSSPASAATTGDNVRDNVEQVRVTPTERTVYTVQISHKGTLVGGSQYVSLAISGNSYAPAAALAGGPFEIDVDSGTVKLDSIKLYDLGPVPFEFTINDTGKTLPPWLSVNNNTGTIAPLDSLSIILTFGNSTQPIGDYNTTLIIESNDNLTGTINIPITVHIGTRRTLNTQVNDFWNIVSLPVVPFKKQAAELYPTTISSAWAYEGSTYVEKNELMQGVGYWMKFIGDQTIPLEGYVLHRDTLNLNEGWNMIGAISNTIPVEGITSDPLDIIGSFFFGFKGNYYTTDSLHAGQGYWIQLNKPGKLYLSGTYPPLLKPSADKILSDFNSITVNDTKNNTQSLYFGSGELHGLASTFFKLPPKPPAGGFDVRFGSGKMLELFTSNLNEKSEYPLYIQSESSPIKICWNIKSEDTRSFIIRDESGKIYPLNKNGSFILNGETSEIRMLTIASTPVQIPSDFVLQQNYPNPFNPTTKLKYGIPNNGYVNIKVYNILGNEVATLVDGNKDAGFYTVDFDASHLPSGLYFYKMKTEKFTAIKKMMLLR
jgi:hypothetical protein